MRNSQGFAMLAPFALVGASMLILSQILKPKKTLGERGESGCGCNCDPDVVQQGTVSICCSTVVDHECERHGDGVDLEGFCKFVENTVEGRNECIAGGGYLYICGEIGTTCDASGCHCVGGRCE